MRSAVVAAAFVAGALAVPYQKRALVVDTVEDVVWVTDVVTVTAGQPAPVTTERVNWQTWTWQQSSAEDSPTSTAPAPAPETTTQAPAPETTTQAPAPETTTQAPAPTTTAAATTSWTSEAATSTAAAGSYSSIVLAHHNIHRQNHSASALTWAADLESSAQQVAESCVYAHNTAVGETGYGQNIAAGVEGNNVSAVITDLFYNGEVNWYNGLYGQKQPSMANFDSWGHFSQIVWQATSQVACYTADCSSGGLANVGSDVAPYFTVCNYRSAGNYEGEYYPNVGEPLGMPTVQWNYGL